ncbi:MAG: DNA mismatch repair protein MutS [Oscillospiraceae bacterium]|nr:DNA mismatch repair protein MutS [Oscillospiraceae bacterium]
MAELTPMMQQYLHTKEQNPDCLLFFRLGDFYEMFGDDARLASKELDLTLTSRDHDKAKSADDKVPMCGVPFHAAESYIARLVAKGYKVAICEQMEDPALAKGLVKRDIVRIVTPGTVTESSMLEEGKNNYFACIYGEGDSCGLSFCDVSTGAFYATCLQGDDLSAKVLSELGRFSPSEVVRGGMAAEDAALTEALQNRLSCCQETGDAALFDPVSCRDAVLSQFRSVPENLDTMPAVLISAGALLKTLKEVQKSDLCHIRTMEFYLSGKFMELDLTARRNLELTETLRSKDKRGSLLWVLDKTKTPMGGRMLRSWLEKPLLSPAAISQRHAAVAELVAETMLREDLIESLREITDLERIMARIVTGSATCRDLAALSAGVLRLPELRALLGRCKAPMLQVLFEELDDLSDLKALIDRAVVDDPPFTVREGGMIRPGYSEEVDRLKGIMNGGKGSLSSIEASEKEKTGIKNLRVGFNRVFGYYIEVSNSQAGMVPDGYIRKQTLVNCERYITQELKDLESTILTAKDRISALEYDLFTELRQKLAGEADRVLRTSHAVGALDTLCSFAHIAVKYRYVRPEIDLSGEIEIRDGRHPVVERVLRDTLFVANDTTLGIGGHRISIITGPNMAGKSTYMRQTALIVLMAQIGCFVPAASARIGVVDRIFTRIGASDDLSSGQSTFMVEMSEVAEILRHATARSLLILDEIGRGTSTFDGMAIARAVVEYAADPKKLGAKTLFATHYHELTVMEQELPGVRNYNIAVKKRKDDIIFLRKIVPGGADDSYGVEVAKLAGLPAAVIARAKSILKGLEDSAVPAAPQPSAPPDAQISLQDLGTSEIRRRLEAITVETLTPIEAMNLLYELKQLL